METGICIQEKLEMCEFSLNAFMQKSIQNFFSKICAICFLLFKAFQRAIKSQNPMTRSRSKYRFSRVTVK